jgi:DNA replication and repair protein RecF
LVGRYPVVLFGPHDLKLVSGQPQDRRRFVDMVGSMTDSAYINLLKDYRQILNQRNAVLKRNAPKLARRELEVWNTYLVEKGCDLIDKRQNMVATIEHFLLENADDLRTPFEFKLEYDSTIMKEGRSLSGDGRDPESEQLKAVFETKLRSLEEEELRRRTTLVGPHRDDIVIKLSGKDVRKYGSQGQRRLLAILLKLAELSQLETVLDEPCVLLLDDVFSEFDRGIIEKLQGLFENGRQVFVTSPVPLDWAISRNVKSFEVRGGNVTEK